MTQSQAHTQAQAQAQHQMQMQMQMQMAQAQQAQAQAQDPRVLGNFTVLDLAALDPTDRARFEALPRGQATPSTTELGRPLLEPHPSWMTRITAEWERRYAR